VSVTFTVRIPRKLAEKMRRYSEINWSEVVRRSIEEYLEKLEEARTVVASAELLEELREEGLDPSLLEPLPAEREAQLYRRVGEAEWKRLSTTQAQ
jgi:Arc/MetJ-type ribon-helix-helix transcriptional regulator